MSEAQIAGKRSVHIFVFDKHGRLLICRRPQTKKKYPNLWTSSAGGRVEKGESYLEAAQRELLEELGVSLTLIDWGDFHVTSAIEDTPHRLFCSEITLNGSLSFEPMEIIEHRWETIEQISIEVESKKEIFAKPFLCAYEHYCSQRKSNAKKV